MTQSTQTIPVGYKQTEIGVIPEDWEVKKLGEFDLDISDGNYSSRYPKASEFKEQGIPFIRANNIKNLRVIDSELRFISNKLHSELIKGHLKKDDILITTRGEIGQIAIVPDRHIDSNINAQVVRINAGEKFNKYYFAYFLIKSDTQESLLNMQTGSALKQLPVGKLKELKIIYPSLPEQTAIATALSDTDTLIEKLEKLIDKKKAVKQGAMQQLLTGKKRLPGFSGEWEVKKLGEVVEILKGSGLSKNKITVNGKYECILYGELFTTYSQVIDDVKSRTNIKEGLFSINGDILMPGSTTTVGIDLATASSIQKSGVLLGGDIIVIRKKQPEKYDSKFLANYLTHISKYSIAGITQGITIIHLHGSRLKDIDVNMPSDVKEQTAIATVLSDMDAEIEKLGNILNKYRQIKTGMMQQLLTGKIRLI